MSDGLLCCCHGTAVAGLASFSATFRSECWIASLLGSCAASIYREYLENSAFAALLVLPKRHTTQHSTSAPCMLQSIAIIYMHCRNFITMRHNFTYLFVSVLLSRPGFVHNTADTNYTDVQQQFYSSYYGFEHGCRRDYTLQCGYNTAAILHSTRETEYNTSHMVRKHCCGRRLRLKSFCGPTIEWAVVRGS